MLPVCESDDSESVSSVHGMQFVLVSTGELAAGPRKSSQACATSISLANLVLLLMALAQVVSYTSPSISLVEGSVWINIHI